MTTDTDMNSKDIFAATSDRNMKVEPELLKLFAEYGAVILDPDAHGCNAPGRHFEF
jgi:hypothetical protein